MHLQANCNLQVSQLIYHFLVGHYKIIEQGETLAVVAVITCKQHKYDSPLFNVYTFSCKDRTIDNVHVHITRAFPARDG